jgi:hypothetical protein
LHLVTVFQQRRGALWWRLAVAACACAYTPPRLRACAS